MVVETYSPVIDQNRLSWEKKELVSIAHTSVYYINYCKYNYYYNIARTNNLELIYIAWQYKSYLSYINPLNRW